MTMTIRRSNERGHADHGWLKSYHTFSFADYYDPAHVSFRALRVINEDWVEPAKGFGTHPHNDMEIITYVLEGKLEHKDSMGNGSVIAPGDVQRMSAGTGVTHSEFNGSKSEQVHLLQIWIMPDRRGVTPSYEQKHFSAEDKQGRWRLIASSDGRDASVTIHQDADVYATMLTQGDQIEHVLKPGRHAWVQVARGSVNVNGTSLLAGDAVAMSDEQSVKLSASEPSEVLMFDMA